MNTWRERKKLTHEHIHTLRTGQEKGNSPLNLSFDVGGGGLKRPRFFLFIFLLKNSLLDHTLKPTCKFLILAIF